MVDVLGPTPDTYQHEESSGAWPLLQVAPLRSCVKYFVSVNENPANAKGAKFVVQWFGKLAVVVNGPKMGLEDSDAVDDISHEFQLLQLSLHFFDRIRANRVDVTEGGLKFQ